MKKLSGGVIILIVLAIIVMWGIGKYNGMVKESQKVEKAWGDVEAQYQRRADLIPNLVETVKGYASHENQTLQDVVNARAKATSITVDINDEASLKKFQDAQGELSQALGRLIAVSESYPDLKANQNFLELQSQLEGTENRITTARNAFNEAARSYNTGIMTFPSNIIANMFGFKSKAYFASKEGADVAPEVKF
ncbi:MAG: LemA family protein [Bacteroidales bacterium]|nr:LemA family protein [Bacteroidales bacterium]MBR5907728.1 LemA family protein [Bacteroidales bacterium]